MPGREPALARARQPEQGDGRDEQQRQKPDQRSGPKPSLRPARRRKHLCGAAPAPGLCFNKVDFIAAGPKLEPQAVYRRIVAVMTDRKTVGEGKSLSVRVDLGVSRYIKKKHIHIITISKDLI